MRQALIFILSYSHSPKFSIYSPTLTFDRLTTSLCHFARMLLVSFRPTNFSFRWLYYIILPILPISKSARFYSLILFAVFPSYSAISHFYSFRCLFFVFQSLITQDLSFSSALPDFTSCTLQSFCLSL